MNDNVGTFGRPLAAVMDTWRFERRTPAVQIARSIQSLFEHTFYRIGIRGASTVAKTALRWIDDDLAVMVNGCKVHFAFPAWDSYYGHYLFNGRPYEPEITLLLAHHAANASAAFLDCGANYGYWSVLAAGVLQGGIAAVELNPTTYSLLERNARSALRPIETINAAIWDSDGVGIAIDRTGPNQSHSAAAAEDPASSEVRSRSIDSIIQEHGLQAAHLLVKVDCEGAEVRALAGATRAAEGGAAFVLEDHGADPNCTVSRHLFDLGWKVATFDETAHCWTLVDTLDAVRAMKTDAARGYNVLSWAQELQPSLRAATQLDRA